jgi:hypothetical protein
MNLFTIVGTGVGCSLYEEVGAVVGTTVGFPAGKYVGLFYYMHFNTTVKFSYKFKTAICLVYYY